VVNTINYERDSAIGLRLQRAAESGDKSVLVRREARTLVVDEPRVLRCETIEKAAKNRLCQHTLKSLPVSISEIAVVLCDEPVIFTE